MHVAIVGNGITGVSAAIRLRELRPGWKISMISGESTYHYSRPALMYVFMGHMTYRDTKPYPNRFWPQQRIDLVRDWVTSVDVDRKELLLSRTGSMPYDRLLIATGSKSNKFGWPGQDLEGVQGLYDLMDLRRLYGRLEKGVKSAVIVGGGLIGIELAEMLHSRGVQVRFLVREQSYWDNVLPAQESRMINRIIQDQRIGLNLETELKEIIDDGSGGVCAVETGDGQRIECQLVGLTAGVSPNLDLVAPTPIQTGRGIHVDWGLRTSVPEVFAAGDCAEIVDPGESRGLVQQVWYTGKMQGATVADSIAGAEGVRYDPGIWYNSAKFLDLEYQTYGTVPTKKSSGEKHLYWEADGHLQAIRVVHKQGRVTGFNLMGMRYRHRVCEAWIREERSPQYVLEHLAKAHFDPEFFNRYEPEIVRSLKEQLAS